MNQVFRNLKRRPIGKAIILDSSSPVKKLRSSCPPVTLVQNPDALPGLEVEADGLPEIGKADDLQAAFELEMDAEA